MMMDWLQTLLSALSGGLMTGGIITFLTLHSQKKKAAADAKKADAEAHQATSQAEHGDADWMLHKVNELDYYYKRQNKKMDGLQKFVTTLISIIRANDAFYCTKIACPEKDPPLGQHHTDIPAEGEGAGVVGIDEKPDRDSPTPVPSQDFLMGITN
jgi:hypothetical protein